MAKKTPPVTNLPRRLAAAEAEELRAIDRTIAERERQIGQITIQALALEGQRAQVLQQLAADHERRNVRVQDIAKVHGIAPDSAQKWHLDTSASELAFRPRPG